VTRVTLAGSGFAWSSRLFRSERGVLRAASARVRAGPRAQAADPHL